MRRYSIARLMIVIVVLAVSFAALRNASDLWGGAILLVALGLLGIAILGAMFGRGADRAWWCGFALFGWGYLTLTMGPWFSDAIQPWLPTTQGIDYLHAMVVEQPQQVRLTGNVLFGSPGAPGTTISANQMIVTMADGSTILQAGGAQTPPRLSRFVRSALPVASNYDAFRRVGHSLFALMAALLGASIARWFQKSRARVSTSTTDPFNAPNVAEQTSMKNVTASVFFLMTTLSLASAASAQVGGNAGFAQSGGRARAEQNEKAKRALGQYDLPPSRTSTFVEASVLMNVKADEYVGVFAISRDGKDVAECNQKMEATLKTFLDSLMTLGVKKEEIFVDYIAFDNLPSR